MIRLRFIFPFILSLGLFTNANATTFIDNTNNGTANPTQNNGGSANTTTANSAYIGFQTGPNSLYVSSIRFVSSNQTQTQTDVTLSVYALNQTNQPTGNPLFQQVFQNVTIGALPQNRNTPNPDFIISPTNLTLAANSKYGVKYNTSSSSPLSTWFFPGVTQYSTTGGTTYLSSGILLNGTAIDLTNSYSIAFQLDATTTPPAPPAPAPASVPTLSEWTQIALAFMTFGLLFWYQKRESV
jgi:hypothetical protein